MSNLSITTKTDNKTRSDVAANKKIPASEINEMVSWMNSPGLSLGTFAPAMTFDTTGNYNDYTPASSSTVTISASGITAFQMRKVKVITDGTVTFAAGTGCTLLSGSLGLLSAGTYYFFFASFDTSEVLLSVPRTEVQTQLSTPTISVSSQDAALRIIFSSEDVNATSRQLYRSTVNDVQTSSAVAGYDASADYVDDNNGAGLTNGTTYYYWGRNTAPGYTSSAFATGSGAPAAGVTQLTQPAGLTATAGNNTVQLNYDAIDANADDVAVQRSLTSGSGFATIATISRALTQYDDDTAVNATTYYYRIIANGSGSYSDSNPSAEVSATPGVPLTQPSGLAATSYLDSDVDLTWDAIDANADAVSVRRSTTSGTGYTEIANLAQSATSHSDTTAVNGTTYYYILVAEGSGGYADSPTSAEVSAIPDVQSTITWGTTTQATQSGDDLTSTGTISAWDGGLGLSDETAAGDFKIEISLNTDSLNSNGTSWGIDTGGTLTGKASHIIGFLLGGSTGNFYYQQYGVLQSETSGAGVTPLRMRRISGTVYLDYSTDGGSSYTPFFNVSAPGTMYLKASFRYSGRSIINLKSWGFS